MLDILIVTFCFQIISGEFPFLWNCLIDSNVKPTFTKSELLKMLAILIMSSTCVLLSSKCKCLKFVFCIYTGN